MHVARAYQAATLLTDGRVLITGGFDGTGAVSSAEIFDPDTNTFVEIDSMISPRYGHAAVLLPGGSVLIVGGRDQADLASAEIFSPDSSADRSSRHQGTYVVTGNMSEARSGLTAVLMDGGKVLVTGKSSAASPASVASATVDIWNPDTGAFVPAQPLSQPRVDAAIVGLRDGRIVIAGGRDNASLSVDTVEVYDPSGSTTVETNLVHSAVGATATLLDNGSVLICGGTSAGIDSPWAQIIQP